MKRAFGWLFWVVLLTTACKKDIDTFIPDPYVPVAATVEGSLGGWVTQGQGQALPGVQVGLGSAVAESDYNGVFFWNALEILESGDVLHLSKPGFFPLVRRITGAGGFFHQLPLPLLERSYVGSIQMSSGGVVDLPAGPRINLPPLSLQDSGGQPFSGPAALFAQWVDPSAPDNLPLIPGEWVGLDATGNWQTLEPWGMLVVEGESGLQFIDDKEMALAFPVPAALQGMAAPSMPLWRLNPETGVWEERATAQFFNGSYTGAVDDFGYWLCARAYSSLSFQVSLQKSSGAALAGVPWRIDLLNGLAVAYGHTDRNGRVDAQIPIDQEFNLVLLDECGHTLETFPLGPFSDATLLPSLTVSADTYPFQLLGSLKDCAGQSLNRGYLKLIQGQGVRFVFPDASGQVSGWLSAPCQSTALTAIGVDLQAFQESLPLTRPLEAVMDLGVIPVCLNADEYIAFTLDTLTFVAMEPQAYREGDQTFLSDAAQGVAFVVNGISAGTFSLATNYYEFSGFNQQNTSEASLIATIGYYGEPDDYIIGAFYGSFKDPSETLHTVSGSFRVRRAY